MTIRRIDFLGLPLDLGLSIEGICAELQNKGHAQLIGYISPSSWAVARKHPDYLNAMQQMTVIRAGGEGVARACRWLTGASCPRISFDMTSLADPFFKAAIAQQATVMLVGGGPSIDEAMQERLRLAYPELKIAGTIHGYGDLAPKIEAVLKLSPDVVIAGMGSPRQENFILALREAGYKGLSITCGGFFDQYLEAADYYPEWIDQYNLRFAWRLYKEPRRLWRRYLIDYRIFIMLALKALAEKYMPARVKRLIAREKGA